MECLQESRRCLACRSPFRSIGKDKAALGEGVQAAVAVFLVRLCFSFKVLQQQKTTSNTVEPKGKNLRTDAVLQRSSQTSSVVCPVL